MAFIMRGLFFLRSTHRLVKPTNYISSSLTRIQKCTFRDEAAEARAQAESQSDNDETNNEATGFSETIDGKELMKSILQSTGNTSSNRMIHTSIISHDTEKARVQASTEESEDRTDDYDFYIKNQDPNKRVKDFLKSVAASNDPGSHSSNQIHPDNNIGSLDDFGSYGSNQQHSGNRYGSLDDFGSYGSNQRHSGNRYGSQDDFGSYGSNQRHSGNRYNSQNDFGRQTSYRDRGFSEQEQWEVSAFDNLPQREKVYEDFNRSSYRESENVKRKSEIEITNELNEMDITVEGRNLPRHISSFSDLMDLPDDFFKIFMQLDMKVPTPIQKVTLPVVLSGRDCIGIAQTGSGKTLGFVLPAILRILNNREESRGPRPAPRVLVMVPTRELCQQVAEVANTFGRAFNIKCALAYGGSPRNGQISALKRADILVATPGRLMDFLNSGELTLAKCIYFVLDEADRMLDMGFEKDIRKIEQCIRSDRQTLMWSATWPREIRNLARGFLNNPVQIIVGNTDLQANKNITQKFLSCNTFADRLTKLKDLLKSIVVADPTATHKVLIFTNTKRGADDLESDFKKAGIPAFALHGDKNQRTRDTVFREIRSRTKVVLIATDVAARGLDIKDIGYVINYDLPTNAESYIHRIGRTARGEKTGISYTFVFQKDLQNTSLIRRIIQILKDSGQNVDPILSQTKFQRRSFDDRNISKEWQ